MKHKLLVNNTILLLINRLSSAAVVFLLLPIYTRYFSAEEYGAVDLILGYILLISPILSLKLDMAAFKYLVNHRVSISESSKIISNTFIILFKILLAWTAIIVIINLFVDIPLLLLATITTMSNMTFTLVSQVTRGVGLTKDFVIISIAVTLLSLTINLTGILLFDVGAEIILLAMTASQLAGALAMSSKAQIHKRFSLKHYDKRTQKHLITYSFPLVIDGASFWVMNTSSRTILSIVSGVAANGLYAVANKFVMIIEQAIGVFFQSFIESATLYSKHANRSLIYTDIMNTYLRAIWSGCILLIVSTPYLFPLLIQGEIYSEAYFFIPILIVAVMPRALQNYISAIYQALGHTKQVSNTTLIGAAVNIALNLMLIFYIGVWAVAFSILLTYLLLAIYRYFNIRNLGVTLRLNKNNVIIFIALSLLSLTTYYLNEAALNLVSLIFTVLILIILNKNIILKLSKHFTLYATRRPN